MSWALVKVLGLETPAAVVVQFASLVRLAASCGAVVMECIGTDFDNASVDVWNLCAFCVFTHKSDGSPRTFWQRMCESTTMEQSAIQ